MTRDVVYEDLSREECLALLARGTLGRLAGISGGRPFVFPVNYALDGETIVFRTAPGTKLTGAGFGRVAFEIDGMDEQSRTGWSVIVQGVASEITEAVDVRSAKIRELDLQPWVPGTQPHWVAIDPESMTGRRLRRDS